jgi:ribA/ribD-fused uncharacterized protein
MFVIPPDNRILYFGRDREAFGFLSHFHPASIELDGEIWPTVEHYYQAQKSSSRPYRQAIREAVSPGQAKRLAAYPGTTNRQRKDSWLLENGKLPRPDWDAVKLDIMRSADWAKYSQNPVRDLLTATGDAELVEDSPSEGFWGIGPDGLGQNWAGRVLTEVRIRLSG